MSQNQQLAVVQPPPKPKLYKSGDKLFRPVNTAFGSTLVEFDPASQYDIKGWPFHTMVITNLPLLPYGLFRQVVAWQRAVAKEFTCESSTSLFLIDDEENPGEKKWVADCFHQRANKNTMTVDISYTQPQQGDTHDGWMWEQNKEIFDRYAELSDVHCTIHNHVNSGAGQSGRDANDEKGLPGWHVTIGNLNQDKLSFHARLSVMVEGKHQFLPLRISDVIDIPQPPGPVKPETFTELENAWLTFDSEDDTYPEEWKGRFTEKKWTNHANPSQGNGGSPSTASGASNAGETLEDFITKNIDDLTTWPWGFLGLMDCSDRKAFKKDLGDASILQMHSALAVIRWMGTGKVMEDLYQELRRRKSLPEDPLPEVAETNTENAT